MYDVNRKRRGLAWVLGLSVSLLVFLVLPVAAQDRTLTVMHCWDAHRTGWVNEMLASFEAAHPGVKVEGQLVSCGVLRDSFTTAYLGGVAPDIVMIHSLDIPALVDQGVFVRWTTAYMLMESQWTPGIRPRLVRRFGKSNSMVFPFVPAVMSTPCFTITARCLPR